MTPYGDNRWSTPSTNHSVTELAITNADHCHAREFFCSILNETNRGTVSD